MAPSFIKHPSQGEAPRSRNAKRKRRPSENLPDTLFGKRHRDLIYERGGQTGRQGVAWPVMTRPERRRAADTDRCASRGGGAGARNSQTLHSPAGRTAVRAPGDTAALTRRHFSHASDPRGDPTPARDYIYSRHMELPESPRRWRFSFQLCLGEGGVRARTTLVAITAQGRDKHNWPVTVGGRHNV